MFKKPIILNRIYQDKRFCLFQKNIEVTYLENKFIISILKTVDEYFVWQIWLKEDDLKK